MDSDLFNIAIVVLVVLAQLVGAIVTAWKKRQARQERQGQGGLVVVDQETRGTASPPPRRNESSWGDDDPFDGDDAYDESEEELEEEPSPEEHSRGELDQRPRPSLPARIATNTGSSPVQTSRESVSHTPQELHSYAATSPHPRQAGKGGLPTRARALLGRGGLRQAILAQTILTPPRAARGLRR